MTININHTEITLRYTFRSLIIYEKITDKSFQPESLGDIIVYMYSTVLGSARDFNISYDEFLDWLDEHPAAITEFSQWLAEVAAKNQMLNDSSNTSANETSSTVTSEKNV